MLLFYFLVGLGKRELITDEKGAVTDAAVTLLGAAVQQVLLGVGTAIGMFLKYFLCFRLLKNLAKILFSWKIFIKSFNLRIFKDQIIEMILIINLIIFF